MAAPRRRTLVLLFVVICFASVILLRDVWLSALANALVHDEPPVKADVAVVLAGDFTGGRVLRGAELVRQGMVPVAYVTGPNHVYGGYECDLAIPFAIRHGFPAEYFIRFPMEATSTKEEAVLILAELQRRQVHSLLLVTNDYHTGRATRIFRAEARRLGYDVAIHPIAVYSGDRTVVNWWQTREGRKTVFIESMKTIASATGL